MCLGIPAQIVELSDREPLLAKAEIGGVRREVCVAFLGDGPDGAQVGDWVLVHVGFALQKIDEEEASRTLELLEQIGEPYEQELDEIRRSVDA